MPLMGSAPARTSEADVQARIFKALQEVALAAGSVLDPGELADLAVEHARDLIGGWSATLVWFEPGGGVRVLADNHPDSFPSIDLEPGRGMSGQGLITGELTVVNDSPAWEHAFDWAIEGGVRSMIGVPLKVRDRPLGCLIVRSAEVGHFTVDPDGPLCACGERGHWEAIASGTALGRMAREAAVVGDAPSIVQAAGGDVAAITGYHVTEAVIAGNADAVRLLEHYAENVALGLAGLANILDPTRIVVSGGLVGLGDLLLEPVRRSFVGRIEGADLRPAPDIVAGALGDRAGMIGAAALARVAR